LRDFFDDLVADPVRTAADGTDNLLSSTQKPSYSSFTNLKDYSHLTVTGDCPAPYRVDDHECFYGPSLTIQQAVHTWRYWALFMVFLVICGSGLLVIYNASDIALSAGGQASAFYVTVFALGNGMGKVCVCILIII
jgi:Ca2+/Na+ antiporter